MNTIRAEAYLLSLSFPKGNPSVLFINMPTFQEVMETLDVFSEIMVHGRVLDRMGSPIAGALVEMWHPLQWGLYGMEYGPSIAPVDPDGQGWAFCITDENGEYFFKTEKRMNQSRFSSTSVDLKVTDENAEVVLAKLYFDEDINEPNDPYLMDMEVEERSHFIGCQKDGFCEFDILF